MTKKKKTVLGLVGTMFLALIVSFMVFFQARPYSFRESVVKVTGSSGHGSGSIVDSNEKETLIMTNRHVCKMGSLTEAELDQMSKFEFSMYICAVIRDSGQMNPEAKILCDARALEYEKFKATVTYLGKQMTIMFNNLKIPDIKGVIVNISDASDLCLLKLPVGNLPPIRIAKVIPVPGTHITALSNPREMTNHQTDGYVGDNMDYEGNTYTLITAEFYAGSSGSPTVNDDGELVGVNTLGTNLATQGYMIPLVDIILFLQGNLIGRELHRKVE